MSQKYFIQHSLCSGGTFGGSGRFSRLNPATSLENSSKAGSVLNLLLQLLVMQVVMNIEDETLFQSKEKRDINKRSSASGDEIMTPLPQEKIPKIQNPSPTKVVDDIDIGYPTYESIDCYYTFLKKTECYTRVNPSMDNQRYITKGMRAILVDWMAELCNNYSLHRVTFHLAVLTLDRYISTDNSIRRSEFQTIGASCVMISVKFCEPVSVSIDMLMEATGDSCTRQQIQESEKKIIGSLEWHLLTGTLADWVLFYIRYMEVLSTKLPYDMYYRCMDLCDRLLLDYDYITFYPREIALAVVSAFCCEETSLQIRLHSLIDKYILNEDCVKWVLTVGLSAPSHPLLQLLDTEEGESTKETILNKRDVYMEFNYVQPHNQLSLTHYTSSQC